jgi:hypothetical protein
MTEIISVALTRVLIGVWGGGGGHAYMRSHKRVRKVYFRRCQT